MENIVNTNNTNLRLCELRVGLFNTLRVSLPMVSPDATDVQVLLTNGTITTAYSATKNTDGVWICDVAAAQFSSFGKQKYEVAYKLDNKQFWDGQGCVNVVPATTSGIVPQPIPPPHRWAIISITQGDITHYADENGDINLDDITRVRWDNVTGKPDFADVATSGSYNDLKDVPTEFPPKAHTHTRSEITDFPTEMPPTAHSHASDNWFTTAINSKADEAKPSFSTITINGVDYTEWTLGARSGKIMLSVDMGGISTEIAAFNPVTGVFESAPSQYRDTLRFDGEAPVVGASPTLFDHVARESALSGKANVSDFSPTNPAPYVSGVIDSRLPYTLYAVPSNGLLKDRAINTTSLASVTVPDDFTDLLIRASVASSLAVTFPDAITTKYGDTFPAAAGEYLITITKTGAAETYVRVIKLEVANA